MPRLALTSLSRAHLTFQSNRTLLLSSPRYLSSTRTHLKEQGSSESSTPGWGGRTTDDHVVNRTDRNDVQSDSSQQAMDDKKAGKEGSSAISGKDEGNNNQRAKETTKAPGPVIGMNDERGGKGH